MVNILIIIAIAISGAVSFSAADSLPGDALYPIKVNVNEKVEGLFAFSSEAESELQAELALRRLEEAEQLKAEGRLDAETRAELESDFRMHAQQAEAEASNLESEGKTEEANSVRTSIQTSISTRGGVLGIVNIDSSSESNSNIEIREEGEARIANDVADLKIVIRDGTLVLTGKLMRSTPCVDWKVETVTTKDMPISNVSINLKKTSTSEVCIQVVGEPQEIEVKIPSVSANANVKVSIEGKVVFSQQMN